MWEKICCEGGKKTPEATDATEEKRRAKQVYLTGVRGLPGNLRGERTFGSKENFSLTFSSTEGATYVKP